MTLRKQFAQDGNALDDCVVQLVEVLSQLLEEPSNPPEVADDQGAARSIADLRSGSGRAIHVVVNK
jgi:hypothetical protein